MYEGLLVLQVYGEIKSEYVSIFVIESELCHRTSPTTNRDSLANPNQIVYIDIHDSNQQLMTSSTNLTSWLGCFYPNLLLHQPSQCVEVGSRQSCLAPHQTKIHNLIERSVIFIYYPSTNLQHCSYYGRRIHEQYLKDTYDQYPAAYACLLLLKTMSHKHRAIQSGLLNSVLASWLRD